MTCKLCLQDTKLIKAHIIPEGFWKRNEDRPTVIHSNVPGFYPKRSQVGIYDTTILCGPCDRMIGKWDEYAQALLLKEFKRENYVVIDGTRHAYFLKGVKYLPLKLFFISVLWRAAISSQPFFSTVRVGPFENQLRKMILAGDPGTPETFSVTLFKFEGPLSTIIQSPNRLRLEGRTYYKFYLGGFVPHIKVSKRSDPGGISDFILKPSPPFFVFVEDISTTGEKEKMRGILKSSLKRVSEAKANRSRRTE